MPRKSPRPRGLPVTTGPSPRKMIRMAPDLAAAIAELVEQQRASNPLVTVSEASVIDGLLREALAARGRQ